MRVVHPPQHLVADLDRVRVAERAICLWGRAELDQREVGRHRGDDLGRQRLPTRKLHRDGIGDLDDVRRGQHVILVDEDARAEAGLAGGDRAGTRASLALRGSDHDDRIRDTLEDLGYRFRTRRG
jgi:hypothetical protein